ncbi:hypothetical protein [Bacillus cereus]|uniref:hypothetical protein n=1 Tax=Bacillus cereus TaxID=1396 RepID=UPI0018F49088|nr:hypothetical protein [Bacillus cereus]MBJ8024907.1 hypothetical protein [Bacillus cereus]MBJ8037421.1 hypothetical protein [Bacillus cereus]
MNFKKLIGASLSVSIGLISLGFLTPTASAAETVPVERKLEQPTYKIITYGGDNITVVPFARTKVTYKTSTGTILNTYEFTNYTTKEKRFMTPIQTTRLSTNDLPVIQVLESVL